MSKKLIGIPGYRNAENNSYGVGITHLMYVAQFGDPVIIMPHEKCAKVDALYLPGGLDINPANYEEVPGFRTQNQDVFKQYFLDHRLQNYVGKVPIFGVCAGFQTLAVFFGSKLTQDLPYHPQSQHRGEEGHKINLVGEDGQLKLSSKKRDKKGKFLPIEISVNSHHHQGVYLDQLNDCLAPVAISQEWDGYLVEIFKHKTLPIVGIQSHPEEFPISIADQLFREILEIKEVEIV